MGQLLLTAAGQAGASFLQAGVSTLLGNLFAPDREGPRLDGLSVQTSTEGAFVPIVYGRMRLAGQVIWMGPVTESARTSGGKGGPELTEYQYAASFAVALCEGPIASVGRIWANGEILNHDAAVMRLHSGAEDQAPDPLIEAVEGQAPAYRGLAYMVFEDLPLDAFGARLPNLSFEVLGAGAVESEEPQLEQLVQGVCLIPASGEFAYATEPVFREVREGEERAENVHTSRAFTNLDAALDDLAARLPNVTSVALVTSWFGTDLRCDQCQIRPGVETREKRTRPLSWRAAGLDRASAHLVSQKEGAPVYGGTPSDDTIIACIRALKQRGYQVTLYPFILMDIPGETVPGDPHGGGFQPAYPWRGRISSSPAPDQPGSPDQSMAAHAQINAFFGGAKVADFSLSGDEVRYAGAEDWGFDRFILHHAMLAKAAGGVESLLIGSELVALTQVRSDRTSYPAVARLKALAGEVRTLVGAGVKLSYAADWSEYAGHAPGDGSGDRLFHLDPLWADPNVDYIGIDWYGPLSDWREGEAHADAAAGSIHDRAYLSNNVEGGEGGDWYYANEADRQTQLRTPIIDGAYGEDWIWAYKRLADWWSNPHHDRVGGVRASAPTVWTPGMKPIRLVELGCPAVDKGSNQPNVFIDPKSAESRAPHFSNGARDDLIQRRYIETVLDYWAPDEGHNPVSTVYGGPMLDVARSHVWCWDGRPFPEFPTREDVWSDGGNWRRGHWLTGRAGQSALGAVVQDVARRAGLETLDVSALDGVLAGFVIDRPRRARDVIASLSGVFGFTLTDQSRGPVCLPLAPRGAATVLRNDDLPEGADGFVITRTPPETAPADAQLTLIGDEGEYAPASVRAQGLDHLTHGLVSLSAPVLADRQQAQDWARGLLNRARREGESLNAALPPSLARLEPGDPVRPAAMGPVWRLDALEGGSVRQARLGRTDPGAAPVSGPEPQTGAVPAPAPAGRPLVRLLDLPLEPDADSARNGLVAAAWSQPWAGAVQLYAGADEDSAEARARLVAPARTGELLADLPAGPEGRWRRDAVLRLRLTAGALESRSPLAVLAGANRLAVETEEGWEVIGFECAALEPDGSWLLNGLLRGLGGSPPAGAPAGAGVVILDPLLEVLPVNEAERGAELSVIAVPEGARRSDARARRLTAVYEGRDLRPLSPVHLRLERRAEEMRLGWIRRTRLGGDRWQGLDVPLGEAQEHYQVSLQAPDGDLIGQWMCTAPLIDLPRADLPSDLAGHVFQVCQVSERYGPGLASVLQM
ncbi:glycoside hydrolase TIM-barrel-like domain-containing protein [Oceanicaulis sp. LC35]|uniref:baseplate multidomain protein megatron n=1 Tax=Oceanicaulis sp. LC35 TaxID=3349635 RepID=UPI003F84A31A